MCSVTGAVRLEEYSRELIHTASYRISSMQQNWKCLSVTTTWLIMIKINGVLMMILLKAMGYSYRNLCKKETQKDFFFKGLSQNPNQIQLLLHFILNVNLFLGLNS